MTTPLNDKELIYFSRLMLRYEAEIKKDSKGFSIKKLKPFLQKKQITLDYKNKVETYNDAKNTIVFANDGSACVSFIRHIRNAFAHNQIQKVKNEYLLSDKYRNKPTMSGRIGVNLLKALIAEMENTRKR